MGFRSGSWVFKRLVSELGLSSLGTRVDAEFWGLGFRLLWIWIRF